MDKSHDKLMTDLQRLLAAQDFKSEEEVQKFMDSIMGQPIPSFPKEALSFKEQAQDLVFEAYELPYPKAKKKIESALSLEPDLIEAYEFLGSAEESIEISMVFYEKGISIGRKLFGGGYLEENQGRFWSIHETRPFMRCLAQYADCLYALGKVKESVDVFEEMIVLNPNDNQGIRDQLLLYLIELNEKDKFKKYAKMYEKDSLAFPLFNHALFAFISEGETDNATKKLKKAMSGNKYVAPKLVSPKPITDFPDHHGIGDRNEADYVVYHAHLVWHEIPGAIAWLKKHSA